MANLEILENRIEYSFKDKELLKKALTHSSYASENGIKYEDNNERLEFIGDGFIDAIVGNKLFELKHSAHEGELSRDRADVVCESSLADIAREINLGDYLLLGKGESSNGGKDKDSILSDAFEALIGAIISDGGYEAGEKVVLKLLNQKIELSLSGKLNKDFKSQLQEKLQEKYKSIKINYILKSESGPDHDKTFNVEVVLFDKVMGSGSGKSKAKAEQAAAEDVLTKGEF